ncbi:MAG: hypothetical protein M1118_15360 [Chloroflexi bacterium]|nr:hypothetical protein [Chloroflexota bacterium]
MTGNPALSRRALLMSLLAIPVQSGVEKIRLPPSRLSALHPKIGVHTRLTNEVEPIKIRRTLDLVAQMGASWIVEYFPWSYLQPDPDTYHWDHSDVVIRSAVERGLTVIARVDLVPDWARPLTSTGRYLPAANYPLFARFLATFARRYQGLVGYLVVWNEPNTAFEWGYRKPDPAAYTALLRTVYPAVKDADPLMQVVTAGLAQTIEQSDNALDDLIYLQRMYDHGAAQWFDLVAAHPYGETLPASAPPAPSVLDFQRVVLLRAVMERNGDAGKQILITEAGWNSAPLWTHAVLPAQRITYTIQAYEMAATWGWDLALCIWQFRLPFLTGTAQDYATFVEPDFTLEPIYYAVQAYAHGQPWQAALPSRS